MSQTAAQFVDPVVPRVQVRQWVLSLPILLRLLLAAQTEVATPLLQGHRQPCGSRAPGVMEQFGAEWWRSRIVGESTDSASGLAVRRSSPT